MTDTTAPAGTTGLRRLMAQPWLWSFAGAIALWLVTIIGSQGQGATQLITTALSFSTFLAMVGIGQMFVITTGPGNVDLSIPATMALSGSVAMKVMATDNGMIFFGILAALGIGVGVGAFNFALIRLLRIPPIIATLSASFLIQSLAISIGRGLRIKPPPAFGDFALARVAGFPLIAIVAIAFAVIMAVVLARTSYGRKTLAIGQNERAAGLAGIAVHRVRLATYILSATATSAAAVLLSGFSGGASLDMGEEFLLNSIAVVVIGGTSVAGGKSNVPGIWGAALFLFLLVAMLNSFGFGSGVRIMLTGLIIIAVITIAGGDKVRG